MYAYIYIHICLYVYIIYIAYVCIIISTNMVHVVIHVVNMFLYMLNINNRIYQIYTYTAYSDRQWTSFWSPDECSGPSSCGIFDVVAFHVYLLFSALS